LPAGSNIIDARPVPGDATGVLFVAQKNGEVSRVLPGSVTMTRVCVIQVTDQDERGLLSIAIHPQFASGQRFLYAWFARQSNLHLAEYIVNADLTVNVQTERLVLTVLHDQAANHNGGWIGFQPGASDGLIYITTGDGGGANDEFNHAQNGQSLLGKILRINPRPSGPNPYSIPSSNPFLTNDNVRDEIIVIGMRNPFRAAFDRADPANFYIADVGQGSWEEVSRIQIANDGTVSPTNLGWPIFEGFQCNRPGTGPGQCSSNTPAANANPVFVYRNNGGVSVIGGPVYRGTNDQRLSGKLIVADFVKSIVFEPGAGRYGSAPHGTTKQILALGTLTPCLPNCALDGELSGPLSSITDLQTFTGPVRTPAKPVVWSFGERNSGEMLIMTTSGLFEIASVDFCGTPSPTPPPTPVPPTPVPPTPVPPTPVPPTPVPPTPVSPTPVPPTPVPPTPVPPTPVPPTPVPPTPVPPTPVQPPTPRPRFNYFSSYMF
jgi:glucose/arabinose dehydrogenase